MKSQWYQYKDKVIELRKQGLSYGEIQQLVPVPRSTLSHWLRNIELTEEQKHRLAQNYGAGLIKARVKAGHWHKAQKDLRLKKAEDEARAVLEKIKIDNNIVDLAVAMLYLGEGAKNGTTALGNSNPLILKFFLSVMKKSYNMDPHTIGFELHLRADQNAEEMKKYWSEELDAPLSSFKTVVFDKRTAGKSTYPHYKGVCIINCRNIAIQRKLINLYNLFCQKVIDEWAHSSAG